MSQYLPTGNFKWINNDMDVMNISDESKKGYIKEVDLEYPKNLHYFHYDLPLAAEQIKMDKVFKLIPNLRDKSKYVLHYRNLKQCLNLGLQLTKINQTWKQSPDIRKI